MNQIMMIETLKFTTTNFNLRTKKPKAHDFQAPGLSDLETPGTSYCIEKLD